MAYEMTPRPQEHRPHRHTKRPFERRADGSYPYFRLATWSEISLTYRDDPTAYASWGDAHVTARKPGRYRITEIKEDGTITVVGEFEVTK